MTTLEHGPQPVLGTKDSSTSSLAVPSKDEMQPQWDGPHDPGNPQNWSSTWKWLTAGIALIGSLLLPVNGTSITVAASMLSEQFNVEDSATFTNTYWLVATWTLGGAFFVIVTLPLMEEAGVRFTYLITYAFFLLMVMTQALAQNFATLLVSRFFTGGCVTLLSNAIASMIPDLWSTAKDRTLPTSLYILFYVVGNSVGPPMFAGVVETTENWRWIFYVQLIIYGALFPVFLVVMRETRAQVILRRRGKQLTGRRGISMPSKHERRELYTAMGRPMFLLSTEPVLFVCTLWSAFALGTVFVFTQSVEQVFSGLYGWSSASCGYVQAAVVIGEVIGWLVSLRGIKWFMESADRNQEMPGEPIPESRLYISVFGSFVGMMGGMFVYAWTAYPWLPWIAPAIGLAMVGFGIQIVISAVADYVTDAYADSQVNGSALAAVCFVENIFSAFLPLASQSMYTRLGFHWASSLLGFLALLLSFVPVVIMWKGRILRERSPFMKSTNRLTKAEG